MERRRESPLPEVTSAERAALQELYRVVDRATAGYLASHPGASCPAGCHRCCTCAAPLVSDVEVALLEPLLDSLEQATRQRVRAASLALRAELEAGEPDDFACPLLHEGRCLVYAARPYLCRSFGHTARELEGGRVRPFTCEVLQPVVTTTAPPLVPARIAALRGSVGRVVDSYLPIWLSTTAAQRVACWPADDRAVVVSTQGARRDEPGGDRR